MQKKRKIGMDENEKSANQLNTDTCICPTSTYMSSMYIHPTWYKKKRAQGKERVRKSEL